MDKQPNFQKMNNFPLNSILSLNGEEVIPFPLDGALHLKALAAPDIGSSR